MTQRHTWFRTIVASLAAFAAGTGMALAADDSKAFNIDYWTVIKSSPTLWVLIIISFIMIAFFIERLWTFNSFKGDAEAMMRGVITSLEGSDVTGAVDGTRKQDVPIGRVLRHVLEAWPLTKAGLQDKVEVARIREKSYMEKRMAFFATMSTTGPFIGLFGTVLGIVAAFHTLAQTGAGGKEKLMAGISEALVATAAGILVGVLSAMMFNFFTVRQKHILAEIDVYARELIVLLVERGLGKGSKK